MREKVVLYSGGWLWCWVEMQKAEEGYTLVVVSVIGSLKWFGFVEWLLGIQLWCSAVALHPRSRSHLATRFPAQ